jgi:hypothetical protein
MFRGVYSSNFGQICQKLKEIQQFETVAQNECMKLIWQSHVQNTINPVQMHCYTSSLSSTYVLEFLNCEFNALALVTSCL